MLLEKPVSTAHVKFSIFFLLLDRDAFGDASLVHNINLSTAELVSSSHYQSDSVLIVFYTLGGGEGCTPHTHVNVTAPPST